MTSQDKPSGAQTTLNTILLAAIILAALWFGPQLLGNQSPQSGAAPTTTVEAESWPTLEATFTPLPTATLQATSTPVSTATPIPLPVWESLNSHTVLRYTVQTVAEAQSPPDKLKGLFGTDRVSILVVGRATMIVDLAKLKPEDITREGNTITVRLPKPEFLEVVLEPEHSSILAAGQRLAFSDYVGLEKVAFEKGKLQLEEQARNDTQMLALAGQLSRLQLTELLELQGFTNPTVTVKQQ